MIDFRSFTPSLPILAALATALGAQTGGAQDADDWFPNPILPELEEPLQSPESDVPYVATAKPIAKRMLELAKVDGDDVIYDLGSGDGRIVIQAARHYGARGVGIEIEGELVQKAREKARKAGVSHLVEFRQGDLFKADISEATVVTLYLLPSVNKRLRPKLFQQLDPGTRVVSHDFSMEDWTPDKTVKIEEHETNDNKIGDTTLYLWTIPKDTPEHLKDALDSETRASR